jgi:hypothetical protein
MDDLTARLAALFWRYQTDLRRLAVMSEAEAEEMIVSFRGEVGILVAKHGREAVVRAALLLPTNLPTFN